MRVRQMVFFVLLASVQFLAVSCGEEAVSQPNHNPEELYFAAVRDAEVAEPGEISRNLTAITANNPELVWEEGAELPRLLVATFTGDWGESVQVGSDLVMTGKVWVTVAPQVKYYFAEHSDERNQLPLRLEQLLGLPPESGKDRVMEFWVNPADLFRPAPDPEISDHEAGLEFPMSPYTRVRGEYTRWFDEMKATMYGDDGYPWTRLGYTYDWAPNGTEIGLSEFIIIEGASVTVHSITDVNVYCGSN